MEDGCFPAGLSHVGRASDVGGGNVSVGVPRRHAPADAAPPLGTPYYVEIPLNKPDVERLAHLLPDAGRPIAAQPQKQIAKSGLFAR